MEELGFVWERVEREREECGGERVSLETPFFVIDCVSSLMGIKIYILLFLKFIKKYILLKYEIIK